MNKTLTLTAAFAAFVLTGSAFAYNPTNSPQATAPLAKLVPSKVVTIEDLPRTFTRRVVEVEFSVDANGQPTDVKVLSRDRAVKQQVAKAFKQWKFDGTVPATEPGAEPKRFILPLEIVPGV